MAQANSQVQGKIVQCIGAVVDVEFPRDKMPKIYDALKMDGSALTLEVQQQLGLATAGAQVQVADEDGTVAANGDVGAHVEPPLWRRQIVPSPDRKMAANGRRLS